MEDDKDEIRQSVEKLQEQGQVSSEDATSIHKILSGDEEVKLPERFSREKDEVQKQGSVPAEGDPEKVTEDLRSKLADMTLPERIKLAMFGNSVARGLLISDSNRIVQECVMRNPQLRDAEVEEYSKNRNVAEYVLRYIANNKSWMKTYSIKYNLVTNPKTPQDVSLKWMRYLRTNDLRRIAKSKNVPQAVAITARKRVADALKKR